MSELALLGGEPIRKAPFHTWPIYGPEEEANLLKIIRTNKWGIGKRTGVIEEFEQKFAAYHGGKYAVACTNCTQALEVMLYASGIRAGDEVIIPAYTFIATASSVARLGAVPVFADIDEKTLLLDPDSVESLITPKTRGIIAVHFGGAFADMESFKKLSEKHKLVLLEDAAQAHAAKWKGAYPGNYAPAGFSFQYSKNMTAGEGGIIISNNESFINSCWEIIWHGRKKGGLWYEHFTATSNFRMTEWSAAVLLAQLEKLTDQTKRRTENANLLTELLKKDGFFSSLSVREGTEVHARHLFPLRSNEKTLRRISKDRLVEALTAEGLPITAGYRFPLYHNPAFRERRWGIANISHGYDYADIYLPNTEGACKDTFWIPQNVLLGTEEDMQDIAAGIRKVSKHAAELCAYDKSKSVVAVSSRRRVNYLLAACAHRKTGDATGGMSGVRILAHHLEELLKTDLSQLDQVTILQALPLDRCGEEHSKRYWDVQDLIEMFPCKVVLLPLKGGAFSYGLWSEACQHYKRQFDYYILVEDDYYPLHKNFVDILIEEHTEKLPYGGYLNAFTTDHAAVSNGIVDAPTFLSAISKNKDIIEFLNRGAQVNFSLMFGEKIDDYANKYRTLFNVDLIEVTHDISAKDKQDIFVPIQYLTGKAPRTPLSVVSKKTGTQT